jgi:succinyl-diaminopimelate desuccinylase
MSRPQSAPPTFFYESSLMAEIFAALDAQIDATHQAQIEFLRELVRIPSDNPPGDCAAHGMRAADLLEGLGFTVERHPVPVELARKHGMISAVNLIVRKRYGANSGSEGPTIALSAHGDVVPPGEGWSVDPYGGVIKDGKLYGRGVAVSKSDFATYAFALKALDKIGLTRGTVELHLTYDEEVGGDIGPGLLLKTGLSKPDLAICAGFSYGVVTAHNGCLHLEVRVRGKIAHAALPETGVDALEATTDILAALYAYRRTLVHHHSSVHGIDHPTLVVGLIKGGVNTNVVPDMVTLRLDRRILSEEDPAAAEAALRELIPRAVGHRGGVHIDIERVLLALPLKPLPGGGKLITTLQEQGKRVFGTRIEAHGVPIYTDARHYAEAGIPTVLYGAGPRTLIEAGGHGADERLVLEDLRGATKVIAATLYELLKA